MLSIISPLLVLLFLPHPPHHIFQVWWRDHRNENEFHIEMKNLFRNIKNFLLMILWSVDSIETADIIQKITLILTA